MELKMDPRSDLYKKATQETLYWVDLAEGPISFTLGVACPKLDAWLASKGIGEWAFLAAHNPHAQSLPVQENQKRHKQLPEDVERLGFMFVTGRDESKDKSLTPEVCLCIFGIAAEQALRLAKRYAQVAIIVGQQGSPPQLLYAQNK